MRGYVYVLTNEAFPDLVKVGFSTKDPSLRVSELNNTSVPTPFQIFYEVLVDEPYELEQRVHARLRDNGEHAGKEFFRVAPKQALNILRTVMEETGRSALFEQSPAYRCQKCGIWTVSDCIHPANASTSSEVNRPSPKVKPQAINNRDIVIDVESNYVHTSELNSDQVKIKIIQKPRSPGINFTKTYIASCQKCKLKYNVTLARYETTSCCPKCFSITKCDIVW